MRGCAAHGGIFLTNITFYMGTCSSNCDRGIGFRCGTAGFILCDDGNLQLCNMGKCNPPINQRSDRQMKASYTFYDNNTLKLKFLNPIPDEEKNNNLFEVDKDDYYYAIRSNKNCTIKVILVNLDKQEWWGREWNKKIRINI